MPHVAVKLYAGRSPADKQRLSEALAKAVMETLGSSEASVSVAIQDVAPDAWMDDVYAPEIAGKADSLFKRPGYGSLK